MGPLRFLRRDSSAPRSLRLGGHQYCVEHPEHSAKERRAQVLTIPSYAALSRPRLSQKECKCAPDVIEAAQTVARVLAKAGVVHLSVRR